MTTFKHSKHSILKLFGYKRLYVTGGLYFFTLVTYQRQPILCNDFAIKRLNSAFHYTHQKLPFRMIGLTVLPDHLHCIMELPKNDSDFSMRWNIIKKYFSLNITSQTNARREKNIWQKRFWEHLVRDDKDFERCLDYVYYNPVKHGYVVRPCDWKYSTFRRDVSKGLYEIDWASDEEPVTIKDVLFE